MMKPHQQYPRRKIMTTVNTDTGRILWSTESKYYLLRLIKENSIIISPDVSAETMIKKEEAWVGIEESFAADGMKCQLGKLKRLWKRMKDTARQNLIKYNEQKKCGVTNVKAPTELDFEVAKMIAMRNMNKLKARRNRLLKQKYKIRRDNMLQMVNTARNSANHDNDDELLDDDSLNHHQASLSMLHHDENLDDDNDDMDNDCDEDDDDDHHGGDNDDHQNGGNGGGIHEPDENSQSYEDYMISEQRNTRQTNGGGGVVGGGSGGNNGNDNIRSSNRSRRSCGGYDHDDLLEPVTILEEFEQKPQISSAFAIEQKPQISHDFGINPLHQNGHHGNDNYFDDMEDDDDDEDQLDHKTKSFHHQLLDPLRTSNTITVTSNKSSPTSVTAVAAAAAAAAAASRQKAATGITGGGGGGGTPLNRHHNTKLFLEELKLRQTQRKNEEERMNFERDIYRKKAILLDLQIKKANLEMENMLKSSSSPSTSSTT